MTPFRQDLKACQKATFTQSLILKNEDEENITLSEGEKIIFGVKSHYSGDYIIKKVLTESDNGVYHISISPEELNITPQRYYYDVSIQTLSGSFEKIIPKSNFDVLESETEKE